MSQTYSTVSRDMASGRIYSTQRSVRPRPAPPAPRRPVEPVPPPKRFGFSLSPADLPAVSTALPGISGRVALEGGPGESYRVTGQITGLPSAPDPAIEPVLWLIHDLTVPADLAQADLAALPKGSTGTGNQPGTVFTMDGNPPTYGPQFNTLSVTVSPGRFTRGESGTWNLAASLDPGTNQGFHPLYFAGPTALADINAPVFSGTLAGIMTDLFMRPTTIHPELPLSTRYLDRLRAITARHLGPNQETSVLDGSAFTRAAVTLEGVVRPTPTLMPTRESCILLGGNREES